MKLIDMFTSMTGHGTLVLCLAATFAGLGCSVEVDPESSIAPESQPEAVASEASPLSVTPVTQARCDGPSGAPIPTSKLTAFYTCMSDCQGAGHPYSGCRIGCCQGATGCTACYEQ